jgi:rhomboid family GlyGly-CTERM serine protease
MRPGTSLALAGLAVLGFLVPGAEAWLEFDRTALAGGQLWRLLTGHWAHWSWEHLGWDVLAFAVLGGACERDSRGRFLACLGGSALAVSLAVWWGLPGMARYRGLSGVDSALFVLLAVSLMQRAGASRRLMVGAWALVGFLAKLAWEGATGGALFVGDGVGPVPLAHLAGASVGFVVGTAECWSREPGGIGWARSQRER